MFCYFLSLLLLFTAYPPFTHISQKKTFLNIIFLNYCTKDNFINVCISKNMSEKYSVLFIKKRGRMVVTRESKDRLL